MFQIIKMALCRGVDDVCGSLIFLAGAAARHQQNVQEHPLCKMDEISEPVSRAWASVWRDGRLTPTPRLSIVLCLGCVCVCACVLCEETRWGAFALFTVAQYLAVSASPELFLDSLDLLCRPRVKRWALINGADEVVKETQEYCDGRERKRWIWLWQFACRKIKEDT